MGSIFEKRSEAINSILAAAGRAARGESAVQEDQPEEGGDLGTTEEVDRSLGEILLECPEDFKIANEQIFKNLGIGRERRMTPDQVVTGLASQAIYDLLKWFWEVAQFSRREYPLRDDQITSVAIIENGELPSEVRDKVSTLKVRIHEAIKYTAREFEAENIRSLEEVLAKKELSNLLRQRSNRLLKGQKVLRTSYRSLLLSLQVFREINEKVLKEIEAYDESSGSDRLASLLLMNALFVAEMADATASFLNDFRLQGLDLVEHCRDEIAEDVELNEKMDLEFEKRYLSEGSGPSQAMKGYAASIEARRKYRAKVREVWDEYMTYLENLKKNVGEYKEEIRSFEAARDNATIQLGFLQVLRITGMIGENIKASQAALELGELRLKSLDDRTVLLLLGIDEAEADAFSNVEVVTESALVEVEGSEGE